MKRKISKIFGVGLALVLVLSLSLVMAAPVGASPDVSDVRVELSDYLHSQASDYHIYFTPGADLAKDVDIITIVFPANTTGISGISDAVDADLLIDEDGDAIWSAPDATEAASEVAGYRLVVTTPVDIAAGTEARIDIIGKLTNPTTDGAYQVTVWTSQETTHVDSASYTIGATSVTVAEFGPADNPTMPTTASLDTGTVGLTDDYVVVFSVTATGTLAADWGTITVTFPPTTTIPTAISADSVYVSLNEAGGNYVVCGEAPVVNGRSVTVKTPVAITAATAAGVYFTPDAGIKNPTCSTDGNNTPTVGDYVGKVYTSEDTGSQRVAFTQIINAASASAIVFDPDSDTSVVVDVAADFDIWTIDMYGNMSEVPVEVDIDIISSSATGEFREDANDDGDYGDTGTEDWDLTPATVKVLINKWKTNDGGWSCQYRDSTAGTYTLTASYGTWTPVTWDMEVVEAEVHVVELYDDDILIDTYDEIQLAINDALTGNTVQVGPGTYDENIIITMAELILESADGAAVTIIAPTSGHAIKIDDAADVIVDGFTIEGTGTGIWSLDSVDTIIQNNIVTFDSLGSGIDVSLGSTGVMVSDNELNEHAVMFVHGSDCTVSDNVFGRDIMVSPIGATPLEGLTITDNTFPAAEEDSVGLFPIGDDFGAINLMADSNAAASTIQDCLIEENTFSNRAYGILYWAESSAVLTVKNVEILNNDITDNTIDGICIQTDVTWSTGNVIKFNTISGNTDYGIENTTSTNVDATHNYWGDDTGPSEEGTGMGDAISTYVLYDPWFVTTVSAGEWATGVASLDARATVGVKVSGATSTGTQKIGVARYTENPMAAPTFTPLADGYFDVYVENADNATEIGIKFYADGMTAQSKVYVWDFFEEVWAECSDQSYNATRGYIWVKVRPADIEVPTVPTISDLEGTPFAISTEEVGVRTLQSIAVTPATASIIVGGTKQFTATGTYNLAPLTEDITATVTWARSVTSVATIDAAGLATGVAEGTTNITATLDTIVSPAAVLTVSGVFDPWTYDADDDDVMEIGEVLNAISDYFDDEITITQVLEVITLYF